MKTGPSKRDQGNRHHTCRDALNPFWQPGGEKEQYEYGTPEVERRDRSNRRIRDTDLPDHVR